MWKLASWSFLKKMWIFEICSTVLPELKTIFKGFSSKQQQARFRVFRGHLLSSVSLWGFLLWNMRWSRLMWNKFTEEKTNLEYYFIFMEKNVIFVCYYLLNLKPTLYLVYFFKILIILKWGPEDIGFYCTTVRKNNRHLIIESSDVYSLMST